MPQRKIQVRHYGVATIFKKAALQFVLRWLRKHKSATRVDVGWVQEINRVAACDPHWPPHMVAQDWCGTFINIKGKRVWMPGAYQKSPDLAATLLNFFRQKWSKLEKSKAGKLKKYFSQNPVVKWDDSFNSREAVEEANKITKYLSQIAPKVPPGGRATTQEDYEHLALSRTMWANRKHSGPVPDTVGNVSLLDLHDKEVQRAVEKLPWGIGVRIDDIVKARKWVVADQLVGEKFAAKVLDKDGFLYLKGKSRRRN